MNSKLIYDKGVHPGKNITVVDGKERRLAGRAADGKEADVVYKQRGRSTVRDVLG